MANHPPIPIMELADNVERLKANDNLKFSQEYEVSVNSLLRTFKNRSNLVKLLVVLESHINI